MSDNWRWIKLSHAYPRIGSGTTPPDEPGNYMEEGGGTNWVTTSELRESLISQTKKQVSDDALKRYPTLRVYRPGSVLFAMYGATIGRLGVLDQPACCNQACCVFEHSKAVSNRYLVYWLQHRRADLVALSVGGGQPNLSQQDLRNERVYCPDPATQRQIADFLDRETARIDLLLEKKQRLVALLGEKHSVELACLALGLAPNEVFDKDNWDQNLPSNWVATSLKNLINPNRQITYGIVQPGERDENGVLMVRGQDYSKGWAQPETVFRVSPEIERPYARARLRAGDLVMTIVGAGVGNVATVPPIYDRANITQTTARLAINPRVASGEYVKGVLESKIGSLNVERFKRGAAQPGLMLKDVARFRVPVPPLDDQKKIASSMKTSAERLENIQTRISATIDRLKEYRSALITAAVTGQIDVTAFAKSGTLDRRLDAIQEEMGA